VILIKRKLTPAPQIVGAQGVPLRMIPNSHRKVLIIKRHISLGKNKALNLYLRNVPMVIRNG